MKNTNDWLVDWLKEYITIWENYHQERLKREATDRWLFFIIGFILGIGIAIGFKLL